MNKWVIVTCYVLIVGISMPLITRTVADIVEGYHLWQQAREMAWITKDGGLILCQYMPGSIRRWEDPTTTTYQQTEPEEKHG